MEGIPVKISEKYKPPRRISLPASVQNKLNTVIKHENYDFGLEHFVLEQMAKLKEQRKVLEVKSLDISSSEEKSSSYNKNTIESILTPVPLQPNITNVSNSQQVVGGINISDFENDTSSPFDSVELKTINDMEVLAHVLGGTTINTADNWTSNENGSTSQHWAWGSTFPAFSVHHAPDSSLQMDESPEKKNKENEVSVIMKNLQKRIEERSIDSLHMKKINTSGLSSAAGAIDKEAENENKKDTLPNPFTNLNAACQTIAKRIGEMGFPLSRAARATEMFGPNEGKVIEFMLEVQSLEEHGYPGECAERALVACEFCKDTALKFLDSMTRIMKLGFKEEEVISALIKAEFDRDKAVDSLIS